MLSLSLLSNHLQNARLHDSILLSQLKLLVIQNIHCTACHAVCARSAWPTRSTALVIDHSVSDPGLQLCLLLYMLRSMQIPLMHGTTSHLVSLHVISAHPATCHLSAFVLTSSCRICLMLTGEGAPNVVHAVIEIPQRTKASRRQSANGWVCALMHLIKPLATCRSSMNWTRRVAC